MGLVEGTAVGHIEGELVGSTEGRAVGVQLGDVDGSKTIMSPNFEL